MYSRNYTKNLVEPLRVRVSERYPSVIKERRQKQISTLKELREQYEDTDTKVSLRKDEIFVDGKKHQKNLLPLKKIRYQKLLNYHFT